LSQITNGAFKLLKDGNRLEEHDRWFRENSAYGAWLKSGNMVNYLLLGFLMTTPQKAHPSKNQFSDSLTSSQGLQNLYHIMFRDNFQFFDVYSCCVEKRATFSLLDSSLVS
jgi:hypothetical protein